MFEKCAYLSAGLIGLSLVSPVLVAEDAHCVVTQKQTSVDFDGPVFRTTCQDFSGLTDAEVKKEKKTCEKGARKNKAKAWEPGACPVKDRLTTCTVKKMGPVTLPKPRIEHTYEEQGGNLSREAQIEVARMQCSQMGLGNAEFVVHERDESAS